MEVNKNITRISKDKLMGLKYVKLKFNHEYNINMMRQQGCKELHRVQI